MQKNPVLILLSMMLMPFGSWAEDIGSLETFSSGQQRTTLIELYTSEGCSSCPPADRWLSGLRDRPGLWTEFVPVAFHVDYWDYIGWKDRFARAGYSQRQRQYAAEGNARFVYTPGFFRNGQEWRGWQAGRSIRADKEKVGLLSMTINVGKIDLLFAADSGDHTELTAHIAALGMGLKTKVRAGENAGKTLRHDFVVLGIRTVPMRRSLDGYVASLPAPILEEAHEAIVAWVSPTGQQTPIQVVGGLLQK